MDVPSQIIAIARSEVDHKDEHILVQVSFNSSGSVKLIATDGEGAYAARRRRPGMTSASTINLQDSDKE